MFVVDRLRVSVSSFDSVLGNLSYTHLNGGNVADATLYASFITHQRVERSFL